MLWDLFLVPYPFSFAFCAFSKAGCSLSVVYGTMPPEALAASTELDRAKVLLH